MSQTVRVPDELAERLTAEAERRGVSVDEVVSDALTAHFPEPGTGSGHSALEAFIGSGSSGQRELFDIHQERARLAERKLAEGA
jgi:Ribbon-helix-helix protein, copG family